MKEDDRRQDTWFVSVIHKNSLGKGLIQREGVLDLPHPMTAFDAADYAVRVEVRDVASLLSVPSHEVLATIWGRRRPGLDPGRDRVCTALARYDIERAAYLRQTPWIDDYAQTDVGDAGSALIHLLDWQD